MITSDKVQDIVDWLRRDLAAFDTTAEAETLADELREDWDIHLFEEPDDEAKLNSYLAEKYGAALEARFEVEILELAERLAAAGFKP